MGSVFEIVFQVHLVPAFIEHFHDSQGVGVGDEAAFLKPLSHFRRNYVEFVEIAAVAFDFLKFSVGTGEFCASCIVEFGKDKAYLLKKLPVRCNIS